MELSAAENFKRAFAAHRSGDVATAIRGYLEVIRLSPTHAPARFLLSLLLRAAGRIPEALDLIRGAVAQDPANAAYQQGYAEILLAADRVEEAESRFRRTVLCDPRQAETMDWVGARLEQAGRMAAAERMAARRRCVQEDRTALMAHASTLSRLGDIDAAWPLADRAVMLGGVYDPLADLKSALMLSPIPEDRDRIAEVRQRFSDCLERVADSRLQLRDPVSEVVRAPFYLAYYGMDDRPLMERFQDVLRAATPAFQEPQAPRQAGRGRPRIGVFSTFFNAHTVLRYTRGLIRALGARDDLETFVLPTTGLPGTAMEELRRLGPVVVPVGGDYPKARAAIQALDLDVLVLADVGMEPLSGALAQSALAGRRIALSGHPVTTGIRALDGYVACPALEPEGFREHYTEPLIDTPFWPVDYQPATSDPSGLPVPDLDAETPVLLCVQSLFKIHPDMDAAFRRMLDEVPSARLFFVKLPDGMEPLAERFRSRLAAAGIDVPGRVRFLPRMPLREFLGWLRRADAVLDSWHFSGGDSTLSALAAQAPVVTRAGTYYRGNQTAGLLRMLGLDETIAADAEDYVARAIRLATDPDWRMHVRERWAARAPGVFKRSEGVDRLIDRIVAR